MWHVKFRLCLTCRLVVGSMVGCRGTSVSRAAAWKPVRRGCKSRPRHHHRTSSDLSKSKSFNSYESFRDITICHIYDLCHLILPIHEARCNSRSRTQRRVDTAEIVPHKIQSQRVLVILELLGKRIRVPGKPLHAHPHREVVTLNMSSRGALHIREPAYSTPAALRFLCVRLPVPEPASNRSHVRSMSIRDNLSRPFNSPFKITDEQIRCVLTTISDVPRDDQFAVSINSNPRPHSACITRRIQRA